VPGPAEFLTQGIPGTGGCVRSEPEDFEVEELPLYPASGAGEHVYLTVEKRGISTREAVNRIARAAGVNPESFGVAGLKDARAVARQRISVAGVDPKKLLGLDVAGVRMLAAERHSNKLRMGHLAGNRFRIRVRGVASGSEEHARASLDLLARRGVPNRFGQQRFGERGDGHLAGAALVRGDHDEFLALALGRPSDLDPPAVGRSREAYEKSDLDAAIKLLPPHRREERNCLIALARGKKPAQAVRAVSKRHRIFLISALQSHLFNRVLEERMPDLDRLEPGDLAWKHDSGAVFRVPRSQEAVDLESERAGRFEVSPSGPMFGYKMTEPEGRPGEIEAAVLAEAGLEPSSFRRPGGLRVKGARRPLRVPLGHPDVTADADDLIVTFALPPGSYATVVMGEVMKT
jgi:tRNA pseudouridine13 synthase